MLTIVETSVWSLALRRGRPPEMPDLTAFKHLIQTQQVVMLGCIRQELLSGIRVEAQFEQLRQQLAAFSDLALNEQTYELAAEMFNQCRAKGIQGSNTDFLICAAAQQQHLQIMTTDQDFLRYREVLGIRLHG